MKSRLLSRLDAAIAAEANPVKADCLRAERACLLARQGQLDDARKALQALQTQYALREHPLVSAWMAIGEGLAGYFDNMGRAAYDKMRRAHALSVAVRDPALQALTSAWLAHMAYVEHDLEGMARHVAEAFRLAEPEHHAARSRACLVVAQAYHFGGRYDDAQPWYAKARHHATSEGDEAMLSAVMHNMAGLHANLSRQAVLCGLPAEEVARRALLITDSTRNFDALVGTASLTALVPLLRAQVLGQQGRYAEALALYDGYLDDGLQQGLARMQGFLQADMAWCRVRVGQSARALKEAQSAEAATELDRDVDDRAAAHSRLAQVFAELGQPDVAARHTELAAADWQSHERDQAHAVSLIDKALSGIRSRT